MDQRDAVIPEDIQAMLASVAGHRLRSGNNDSVVIVAPILAKVAIRLMRVRVSSSKLAAFGTEIGHLKTEFVKIDIQFC